ILERPVIDAEKCDGCGICVDICDGAGFRLVAGKAVVNPGAECDFCSICEAACPTDAISCFYEIVLDEDPGKGGEN
ncbi:MAG: 4Fe-4S binding protein, partial [Dehalococcoidia bacterium]